MSSRVRRCGGCGGPLSEAADERGTITCAFCGMVNEVAAPTPQPQQIIITMDPRRRIIRPGGGPAFAVSMTILVIVGFIGFVTWQTVRPRTNAALGALSREAMVARELTKPVSLTDLPTLNERGQRSLNAPPPPGGWTGF